MPYRKGRKSAAQTPAPPSERIYGSKKNPKGTAKSSSSASKIVLSEKTIAALREKVKEYNKKHTGKVSLNTLKAVYRRGAGAYSSTHRPTITGGAPNSRNAWAMARVNKFLLKKSGAKVKAAYVQDDDLMAEGGIILYHGSPYSFDKFTLEAPYPTKEFAQAVQDKLISLGYDGIHIDGKDGEQYVAFYPEQIKLADGTNTTFDSNNPDIRFKKGGEMSDFVKAKPITYTIDNFKGDLELSERWLTDWQRERWVKEGQSEEQIDRDVKLAKKEINLLTSRTPFTTWFLDIPKGKYKFEIAGATYEIKKDVRKVDVEFGWKRYKQNKNFWYVVKTNDVQTPFDNYIVPFIEVYPSKTREYDSKEILINGINRYFRNLIREDISEYPLPDNPDMVFEEGGFNDEIIVCSNCLWSWKASESTPEEKYICHNCGHDNTPTMDKITMDVPLFIRLLEYAREDAKDDMALHTLTENAIKLGNKTLTMADYEQIIASKITEGKEDVLEIPTIEEEFKDGGVVVGKRHSEEDEFGTGEKFLVESTGQVVELEGGEGVMCKESMQSSKQYTFDGKKMTGRQIASLLNHKYGGVEFANGGEVDSKSVCGCRSKYYHGGELPSATLDSLKGGEAVVTVKTMESKDKYNFQGKEMTPRKILSHINAENGGKKFEDGGIIDLTEHHFKNINKLTKMVYFTEKILYF